MTTPHAVVSGQYLAVLLDPFRGGEQKNQAILDGCLRLPNLFPLPGSQEERRFIVAAWLTDANNLFWEVWHQQQIVGIIGLTRVIPGLDALAHFGFFDKQLLGKRTLVLSMMGWAF